MSVKEPQAISKELSIWIEKNELKSLKGDKILSEYKGRISAGLTKKKQLRLAFLLSSFLFGWHNGTHYQPQENSVLSDQGLRAMILFFFLVERNIASNCKNGIHLI